MVCTAIVKSASWLTFQKTNLGIMVDVTLACVPRGSTVCWVLSVALGETLCSVSSGVARWIWNQESTLTPGEGRVLHKALPAPLRTKLKGSQKQSFCYRIHCRNLSLALLLTHCLPGGSVPASLFCWRLPNSSIDIWHSLAVLENSCARILN